MNIFVTVGHTHYNALFKAVDAQFSAGKYKIINQIFDGSYQPKNHEYFKFTTNIESQIAKADLVITHAGAGSVFRLLELGKPIVVVPNFERIDEHQKDLADYVEINNFACVCRNLDLLEECTKQAYEGEYSTYERNLFDGYTRILSLLSFIK
jgi:beta-1,4-N-acetylglucosaminyltransferase